MCIRDRFLDCAEVRAVRQEMGGKGVAEGMWVQVPVYVDKADIFFDDAAYGALGQAASGVVQKDGGGVRGRAAVGAGTRYVQQEFLAQRPVFFKGFLGFAPVGNDPFFIAFAADAENAVALIDVDQVEAGEFADAQTRGVEKFEEGAVAGEKQGFFHQVGVFNFIFCSSRTGGWLGVCLGGSKLIQECVHFFGGKNARNALGKFRSGDKAGGAFFQQAFADAVFEERAERGQFAGDGALLQALVVELRDEFTNYVVSYRN